MRCCVRSCEISHLSIQREKLFVQLKPFFNKNGPQTKHFSSFGVHFHKQIKQQKAFNEKKRLTLWTPFHSFSPFWGPSTLQCEEFPCKQSKKNGYQSSIFPSFGVHFSKKHSFQRQNTAFSAPKAPNSTLASRP